MSNYPVSAITTVSVIKVTVILGEYTKYTVTWPAQIGATGYNILGSPNPITMNRIQSGQNLPSTQTSFDISLPLVPQDVVFNFWVEAIFPGPITRLIQASPATLFDDTDTFNPSLTSGDSNTSNPKEGSFIIKCSDEQNLPIEQMGYIRDEIKRRHISLLLNDGEDFVLYLRRWAGQPCIDPTREGKLFDFSDTVVAQVLADGETIMIPPVSLALNIDDISTGPLLVSDTSNFTSSGFIKVDDEIIAYTGKTPTSFTGLTRGAGTPATIGVVHTVPSSLDPNLDPNYNVTSGRCERCYGTGIFGGYWPGINIKARYGESPERPIAFFSRGAELQHSFPSWTLWLPRLHEHDILIRLLTGERFEIVGINESVWRGTRLSQRFKTNKLQPGDIRYKITDAGIQAGLDFGALQNPAKFDMSQFDMDIFG